MNKSLKTQKALPPQAYKKQITNIEEGINIERKKTKLKTPLLLVVLSLLKELGGLRRPAFPVFLGKRSVLWSH
jgi:hypothetical protein